MGSLWSGGETLFFGETCSSERTLLWWGDLFQWGDFALVVTLAIDTIRAHGSPRLQLMRGPRFELITIRDTRLSNQTYFGYSNLVKS